MRQGYFIKLVWDQPGFPPALVFYKSQTQQLEQLSIPPYWKATLGTTRYCTGYQTATNHLVCPQTTTISFSSGATQCPRCHQADPFACLARCRGVVCDPSSPQTQRLCFEQAATVVYLTLIGEQAKIGVSAFPVQRWLEQGSDYSVILWKGNGLLARKLEYELATKLNLAMRVTVQQKIAALSKIQPVESATQHLLELREQIHDRFTFPASKPYPDTVYNLLNKQVSQHLSLLHDMVPTYTPITAQSILEGEHLFCKGNLLVIKQTDEYYLYYIKELVGWSVKLGLFLDK